MIKIYVVSVLNMKEIYGRRYDIVKLTSDPAVVCFGCNIHLARILISICLTKRNLPNTVSDVWYLWASAVIFGVLNENPDDKPFPKQTMF